MDQFSKLAFVQGIIRFWNTLTSGQKLVTTIFVAASIGLLGVVSVVATRPRMEVLFSGLEPDDAGAIVAKLQERKTPYEISGTAVKVPARDAAELRMELASAGLPRGGNIGFEIFDKTNFGMTEFDQRVSYQRALQGELSRTINELDGVEQTRVLITIPERELFDKQDTHPQASVKVKLRPGSQLGSDQVAGVVHLVSAAVQGMKPDYVSVVDTRGNVLHEAGDTTDGMDPRLSSTQLQVKQNYEREIQKDIQSMLDRVVGPNKAIVRVSAKLDLDRKEISSEVYGEAPSEEPGKPSVEKPAVLVTEQRLTETYGGGAGTGGTKPKVVPEGKSNYERNETTSKYEVSKTTRHIVELPGSVQQVSVAVMLDGSVSMSKIPSIRNAVEAAAGLDLAAGDKVTVESVPFDNSVAKDAEEEFNNLAKKQTYASVGKTVGGVLLIIGFLFFLRMALQQVKIGVPETALRERPAQQSAPVAYDRAASLQEGGVPAAVGAGVSPGPVEHAPEEVAQVVREWISN